ncbi:Uncharacterised protein [Pseudomonas putida]|uniref:hypothetical protein n=1 Tax=Pseudomonas TaxID=286 RepID=UPI000CD417CD|nr:MULTISPECIES: hypothetical protein [Pseudomonas]POF95296.1 hypothetical protein BGP81_00615 [Pseudomonas putida]WPU60226.1 hypothetical protein SQW15_26640 [Pseudomonas asiatica]CAB5637246.1 Uncharacterised protein [Pseudomonas putida]CAB5683921.1 Uncharacterised protein [Pseudomonas putida]CAB5712839.1 Uncharacterised protein [Pseudomonas putida]
MKYRIDYNLKGHTRFWICDWPSTPNEDNVLTALLRLHAPADPLSEARAPCRLSHDDLRIAIADLGISDVRIEGDK